MNNFSFRLLFLLPDRRSIGCDENTLIIHKEGNIEIFLESRNHQAISNEKWLVLIGKGFITENEALLNGKIWRAVLERAFAINRLGIDFGDKGFRAIPTDEYLESVSKEKGKPVLNDVHGLMTYKTDINPAFISIKAITELIKNVDDIVGSIKSEYLKRNIIKNNYELAYIYFSESFFQITAESRFILLMFAFESLINRSERNKKSLELIRHLMEITKNSDLSISDKESIIGVLKSGKFQSIGAAGRKLAGSITGKRYLNMEPKEFFKYCYKIRSKTVHGGDSLPESEEIDNAAVNMEILVSDLFKKYYT